VDEIKEEGPNIIFSKWSRNLERGALGTSSH